MSARRVPPWRDEWSDGCTAAPSDGPWGSHLDCCLAHDLAYYLGGSREDRLEADLRFYLCLRERGMPQHIAWLYFRAVRDWGKPDFKAPGVSWAFGGGLFEYTVDKAVEEPELATEERPW